MATVKIRVGLGGSGTGSVIGCEQVSRGVFELTIITADHVANQDNPRVEFGAERFPALAVVSHPTRDVALIKVRTTFRMPTLQISTEALKVGDRVYGIGYGGSMGLWLTEGLICAEDRASISVCPGDSGGAVCDSMGRLIGVIEALERVGTSWFPGAETVHHHAMFVPVASIAEWVASNR